MQLAQGVGFVTNVYRSIAWVVASIVAVVILTVFIRFLLEIALLAVLVSLAYYWFSRARAQRNNRPWR